MRGRGLKRKRLIEGDISKQVAPHAGAWIETQKQAPNGMFRIVAPHAGAWIETFD